MASKLFPLTIYEQQTYFAHAQDTSLWLGFYFGFLAVIILYHLLLFLYYRNTSYLLFSAYLLAYLTNELLRGNGNYIERLVLVYHPFWQEHVVALLNGVIVLVSLLGLRFYSVGLHVESTGWMWQFLRQLSLLNLLIYAALLTGIFPTSYSLLFNFTVPLVSYLAVLVVSLIRLVQGFRPAWYYFGGTLLLFAGVLTVLFDRAGLLHGTSFWQHNAIQLASIAEITLLSMGFAEGIRAERRRRKLDLEIANLSGRKTEREWLSVVLHTSFGTTISTMLFEMSQLNWLALTPPNRPILVRVNEQLDEALGELRILARSIPPTLLDEQGLGAALDALFKNYNSRKRTRFYLLKTGTEKRIEPRHEFELYLICLELVNNVVRHANAGAAWLELVWEQQNQLTIRMHDNGQGFSIPLTSTGGGYGLESVRRLVEQQLDGSMEVTTAPGGGALLVIRVVLPLAEEAEERETKYNPVQQLFGVIRSYF